MSIIVKTTDINTDQVSEDLHIEIPLSKYAQNSSPQYVYPYKLTDNNDIYLPFGYAMKLLTTDSRPSRDSFDKSTFKFSATLRENQEEIKKEALHYLNTRGCVMISAYPGFGKTLSAIKLASMIKLPVLVITKGLAIINQWKESIEKFSPDATCQIIKPKTKIHPYQNFYVVNAQNAVKIDPLLMKKIGLVIIDECHQVMTETLSKSLTCVTPRYLIGLTATPYRYDGYDALIGLYFGITNERLLSVDNEGDTNIREELSMDNTNNVSFDEDNCRNISKNPLIYRKLWIPHTVYKINTGFKPIVELNAQGRPDWGKILDSQACDTGRNETIIKIIKRFDKRVFLILTKRIAQAEYLLTRLKEEDEYVTSLFGSQKTYCGEARILIGTTQKVGTGFDHPRLNTLLLATDTLNYYIQNLGRVCRSPDSKPIFFDLVDDYTILKRHFNERKNVYTDHGGKFRDFNSDYPDFSF